MIQRIYHLMIKEFLTSLRDPKARLLLIVPPILQVFVFAFAITQEVKNVTLAIYNQDQGIEGAVLAKRFENTPTFTRILMLRHRNEIDPVLDNRRAVAVLVIPQDFSEKLLSGTRQADVQVLIDGRRTNASLIVNGYIQKILAAFGENRMTETDRRGISGIDVVTRNWFNANLNPRDAMVPCLICILATLVGLLLSGLSIAREREMGTFEQLLVSPFTPAEILIGKAVPAMVMATFSACLITFIVVFGFGIGLKGSFWLLMVSLEAFLLAIIGIGLFISSMSMTQQQAILGCFLIMPPSIMLSGFATPVENMPAWFQVMTLADPVRWFMVIIKGLFLKGMSVYAVFANMIPLLLIAAVTLSAAVFMFKRRME
ncbi:MAG: ABC transporter permease [Planctomycetaceae bacterium]|nr:ABC transporter permease [Planctomycetaceae bacterium]